MKITAKFADISILTRIVSSIREVNDYTPLEFAYDGLRLQVTDAKNELIVSSVLPTAVFENYSCDGHRTVCASTSHLLRALKSAGSNRSATLVYDSEELLDDEEYMSLQIHDVQTNGTKEIKIFINAEDTIRWIGGFDPDATIEMPSTNLKTMAANLEMFGCKTSITATPNGVKFACDGDTASIVSNFRISDNHTPIEERVSVATTHPSVSIEIKIAFLLSATKTALSDRVTIYLNAVLPIAINYGINNGGFLRFILKTDDTEEIQPSRKRPI